MSALEKTKTLNPNKVSKLKKKVYKIMNDCRVESGENIKLTHVSMGEPYGRFVIKDKKLKKFLKYYGEAVDYGIDFHISDLFSDLGCLLFQKYKALLYDNRYTDHIFQAFLKKYY